MTEERIGRACPMKDCDGHLERLRVPVSMQENLSDELQTAAAEKQTLCFGGNQYEGCFVRCDKCGFTVIQMNLKERERVPT